MKRLAAIIWGLVFGMGVTWAEERPNIIWVVAEDQSRHYGCYGEPLVHTPHIDRLAEEGVKFTNAMVTAPVCSTARSALATGMYQTSIGAHHHRSGRGTEKIVLPEHVKLIAEYFQDAGYYTCLGSSGHLEVPLKGKQVGRLGKSDYNFEWDEGVYDAPEWSGRAEGQPFFAQVMISGGKARNQARVHEGIPHVETEAVKLPPYYPDHPVVREDWAAYLDTFSLMDLYVGQLMERLEAEGIANNTIIFFLTDHGVSHARGKQFCYDEGIMVPLIMWGPGRVDAGTVRDDLVAHIDIAATSMDFAGIEVPEYLESRSLVGDGYEPREYVVSARDRCDETYDRIRSVRTGNLKYIRNGYPGRPHLQPCAYKDKKEIYEAIREWGEEGRLSEMQAALLLAPERAGEELYDLENDPWELTNLVDDPDYKKELRKMRKILDGWIEETGDQGQEVEAMAMYDSDMELYLDGLKGKKPPEHLQTIRDNIATMKRWWEEGK